MSTQYLVNNNFYFIIAEDLWDFYFLTFLYMNVARVRLTHLKYKKYMYFYILPQWQADIIKQFIFFYLY